MQDDDNGDDGDDGDDGDEEAGGKTTKTTKLSFRERRQLLFSALVRLRRWDERNPLVAAYTRAPLGLLDDGPGDNDDGIDCVDAVGGAPALEQAAFTEGAAAVAEEARKGATAVTRVGCVVWCCVVWCGVALCYVALGCVGSGRGCGLRVVGWRGQED